MKKTILALAIVGAMVSAPVTAKDDQTIMFEIGVGFGNASGGQSGKSDKLKFCKNRNQGRMIMGAIRYSYNDVEAHVAKWWGDDGGAPRCNRDSMAVGLGYVLDTQGDNKAGTDGAYASWTPGVAYTWGKNKNFTGQDADNTNWRQTGNFQTFNRVAIGAGGNDGAVEVAVHRYGTWNPEHGENFITIGGQLRSLGNGGTDRPGDTGTTITIVNDQPITPNNTPPVQPVVGNVTEADPQTDAP